MGFSIVTEMCGHQDGLLSILSWKRRTCACCVLPHPPAPLPNPGLGLPLLSATPINAAGAQLMPTTLRSDLLEKLGLHPTGVWAHSKAQTMRQQIFGNPLKERTYSPVTRSPKRAPCAGVAFPRGACPQRAPWASWTFPKFVTEEFKIETSGETYRSNNRGMT